MFLEKDHKGISLKRQCELLGIARSTAYYQKHPEPDDETVLKALDEIYTSCPFYGKRKMVIELRRKGFFIGIKKVRRFMRKLGLISIYRKPKTSEPHPLHRKYPYLLRGVKIDHSNQVWGTDITFIRMQQGWVYLVAILDWYSRYVLGFGISITLEKEFCLDTLDESLKLAKPEIFNSDQGAQFTSHEFTEKLEGHGIRISMDGRGRCLDNIFTERLWKTVKYEEVYLKSYGTVQEAREELQAYFDFYNHRRPHQSLNYKTPAEIYFNLLP